MLPLHTLGGQTWLLSLHFLEVVEVCSFWKVMKNICICLRIGICLWDMPKIHLFVENQNGMVPNCDRFCSGLISSGGPIPDQKWWLQKNTTPLLPLTTVVSYLAHVSLLPLSRKKQHPQNLQHSHNFSREYTLNHPDT